jgi:hypothetical protein
MGCRTRKGDESQFLQALWEGYPDDCDKCDARRYAYCAKQSKDYRKALDEAKLHLEYIYRLRQSLACPPDYELLQVMNERQVNVSPEMNMKEFERRISTVWNELKYGNKTRYSGRIKSLLPNGKAGFVETDKGKSYYFKINQFKGKAQPGLRVVFYLEEGFDVKKNKKTMNAVNIVREK